jgi:hypothetical protein
MTRLDRELEEIFQQLHVEVEHEPASPAEHLTVACLCHVTDHRDWKRLAQHLEAAQGQIRQRCTLTWTTHMCNPEEPGSSRQVAQAAKAIADADILIVGLSVDMQLLLQQEQKLSTRFFRKLDKAWKARQAAKPWGLPPYVAGVYMTATLWEKRDLPGIELLPHQSTILAEQRHKDSVCTEIARSILGWAYAILDRRSHDATKRKSG